MGLAGGLATNGQLSGGGGGGGGTVTQVSSSDNFIAVATGTTTPVLSEGSALTAALAAKAPLASPAFTGTPTAPTQTALTANTDLATTAYTDSAVGVETSRATTAEALLAPRASPTFTGTLTAANLTATGTVTLPAGSISQATINGLAASLALLATLASPTFTGTVTLPNISASGTTAFSAGSIAQAAISGLTAALALLAPLASPALTGTPTAPTQTPLTSNTDIATTAYADAAVLVEKNRATTAEALLGPPTLQDTTLSGSLNGPSGAASVGVANDVAFFSFIASASYTLKHLEAFTSSTFAGTNNTDLGIYSLNTSTGVLTPLWTNGTGTENSIWGTPGTSAHAVAAVNGATGVALTQGTIYFAACYMASAADGFRGSVSQMSGARLRGYNGLAYGKLAALAACPIAAFNISTLIAIGYGFLFNMLPY